MTEEKKDRYDTLQLLGDILRNYEKYEEAIGVYNKAISRIPAPFDKLHIQNPNLNNSILCPDSF